MINMFKKCFFTFAIIAIVSFGFISVSANAMQQGIDVSSHQGEINWDQVRASGVRFAILRAGYGWRDGTWQDNSSNSQIDKQFQRNYNEAKRVGIPVGAYLYSYATNPNEANLEADFFLELINGKQFEYPVCYDVEDQCQNSLNRQQLTDVAETFLQRLANNRKYAALYCSKNFAINKLDMNRLARFDTWIAQWPNYDGDAVPLNLMADYNGQYGIWQYCSDGHVLGINGNVDKDRSYKDYIALIVNNHLNGF